MTRFNVPATAILLALVATAFVLPSAGASGANHLGACTEGTYPCTFGKLACVTDNGQAVACAPDPCATTRCTADSSTPIPVYSCNAATKPCWNGALACFAISEQVPFCVQDPCNLPEFECLSCSACNLVYVCVAGHTAPSCYDNQFACVGFSEEIPFCLGVAPIDAQCMERYVREDVGPVSVVSPNSCSYQVDFDGQPILG